jgi:membrane associated rhomboid family serine protease
LPLAADRGRGYKGPRRITLSRGSFHELYPVTALLALLVIGFFLIELLAHQKLGEELRNALLGFIDGRVLDRLGSMNPRRVQDGEVWRLVAAAFLHGNVLHLVFNTFVLVDLGRFCEPFLSSAKFFTAYIICAIAGSLGSYFYSIYVSPRVSVGASGALAGLIGLMLSYSIKERDRVMRDSLVRWIAYIVLITLILPRIDHAAHAGGFAAGLLLGLTVKPYTTSVVARRWRYPSYAAGAVLAVSLGFALWNHFAPLIRGR